MFGKIKSLLLGNHTASQTVAKNTFWLAVSNFGGRFIRAAIIIYAARVLGPSEWGIFNYVMTIVAFLTLFVDFGIGQIVVRERARTRESEEKYALTASALWLKLFLAILGVMVVIGIGPLLPAADAFLKEKSAVLFPIVAFVMLFDTMREFFNAILRSEERMEREAASFLITNVFIVAWGFVFLFVHPTVRGFALSYVLGTGMGLIASTFITGPYLKNIRGKFSLVWAKRIIASAWPYALSGVMSMLMINTDIVMLGWLRSSEEVGFYSAPHRIMQILYLLPTIIGASILPLFSRLATSNAEKMRLAIERSVGAILFIAFPLSIGGILVAKNLVILLFGTTFVPGVLAFQILLLTLLVDFAAVIMSYAILAYDHQRSLITYSAIGGLLNVFLNALLIPRFGIVGCALATLAAQMASNIYLQITLRRLNSIHLWSRIKNAVPATVLMALVAYGLQYAGLHVLGVVAVSVLTYGVTLYLLREPIIDEIMAIVRSAPAPHETDAARA